MLLVIGILVAGTLVTTQIELGITRNDATATQAQYDKLVACGKGDLDKSGVAELTFKGRNG